MLRTFVGLLGELGRAGLGRHQRGHEAVDLGRPAPARCAGSTCGAIAGACVATDRRRPAPGAVSVQRVRGCRRASGSGCGPSAAGRCPRLGHATAQLSLRLAASIAPVTCQLPVDLARCSAGLQPGRPVASPWNRPRRQARRSGSAYGRDLTRAADDQPGGHDRGRRPGTRRRPAGRRPARRRGCRSGRVLGQHGERRAASMSASEDVVEADQGHLCCRPESCSARMRADGHHVLAVNSAVGGPAERDQLADRRRTRPRPTGGRRRTGPAVGQPRLGHRLGEARAAAPGRWRRSGRRRGRRCRGGRCASRCSVAAAARPRVVGDHRVGQQPARRPVDEDDGVPCSRSVCR